MSYCKKIHLNKIIQIVLFIFRFNFIAAVELVAHTMLRLCVAASRIAKYTQDMKRADVEKSFRSALKMWSDAAPLTFNKVNHGKADIVFSFARRSKTDKL